MNTDPTHAIDVQVETAYLPEQSEPENERFAFSYTIVIDNIGSVAAKLISRHWIITDANGKTEEVRGMGVVGEQPHLAPGQAFRYTSGTILQTPLGSMRGTYQMVGDDGTSFEAKIPIFTLAVPHKLH